MKEYFSTKFNKREKEQNVSRNTGEKTRKSRGEREESKKNNRFEVKKKKLKMPRMKLDSVRGSWSRREM